jgi:hypothetical protein
VLSTIHSNCMQRRVKNLQGNCQRAFVRLKKKIWFTFADRFNLDVRKRFLQTVRMRERTKWSGKESDQPLPHLRNSNLAFKCIKMSLSSNLQLILGSAERASSSRKMLRNMRRQNMRALGPKTANWGAQVLNHRLQRPYLHQDAKRNGMLIYLLILLLLSANGDVLEIYLFSSVTYHFSSH